MEQKDFKKIFEIQKSFSEKIFAEKFGVKIENLSRQEKIKWSKEYILCMIKESTEMLDEINWKTHRDFDFDDKIDNFAEEGIDVFKFLINLFIINGLSSETFYEKYLEKSLVVDIRYEQEKKLRQAKECENKFVVFDIDGVLNDYPNNFIRYSHYLGYNYSTINEFKSENIHLYNSVKKSFRLKGEERNCKINLESKNYLLECKKLGYQIILLTARPYNKISRLYYDTQIWLESSQIPYDYLFFSNNKEQYLIENFNPHQILFVVDDQPENANKLCDYFKTYLLNNKDLYSCDSVYLNKKITLIQTLNEIKI